MSAAPKMALPSKPGDAEMKSAPTFPYEEYRFLNTTPERQADVQRSLVDTLGYIVGGWTTQTKWKGAPRTK